MSGDSHGHGGSSKLPVVLGWVAVAALGLVVFNGFMNKIDNKPLLSGIFDQGVPRPTNTPFNGLSTAPPSSSNRTGKMTGDAGNCPVGKKVGEPYQCPTSRTGWCVCQ